MLVVCAAERGLSLSDYLRQRIRRDYARLTNGAEKQAQQAR